ncbi:hypothetical protein QVD17_10952 [Tagetes erecta]|uniref:Uncharacterized protein n=1 Tax=Tagetes erecta TaxID=13708 RepID=A0AAD8L4B2_TARER|nr:hypothetical protein QVD17_10952 [Tagetes erecta]
MSVLKLTFPGKSQENRGEEEKIELRWKSGGCPIWVSEERIDWRPDFLNGVLSDEELGDVGDSIEDVESECDVEEEDEEDGEDAGCKENDHGENSYARNKSPVASTVNSPVEEVSSKVNDGAEFPRCMENSLDVDRGAAHMEKVEDSYAKHDEARDNQSQTVENGLMMEGGPKDVGDMVLEKYGPGNDDGPIEVNSDINGLGCVDVNSLKITSDDGPNMNVEQGMQSYEAIKVNNGDAISNSSVGGGESIDLNMPCTAPQYKSGGHEFRVRSTAPVGKKGFNRGGNLISIKMKDWVWTAKSRNQISTRKSSGNSLSSNQAGKKGDSTGRRSSLIGEADNTIEVGEEVGFRVQGYERQIRSMVAGEGDAIVDQ